MPFLTYPVYRIFLIINRTRLRNYINSKLAFYGLSFSIDKYLKDPEKEAQNFKHFPDYISFIVKQLLLQIELLNTQIEPLEEKVNKLLPESNSQIKILMSHPGIGPIFSRTIYTEIFKIEYFKGNPEHLISYSGLSPIEDDSDGRKGKIKLNQHCNYWLKYAFVESAHCARKNERFKYKYQSDVKKHGKIIAKINLSRRICKSVFWMLTRQEYYKFK